MTTIELMHRIGRRARGGDFTLLSMTEQVDLLDSANNAIQHIYNALPIYFKEQTVGFLLPLPRDVTFTATQYSNQLSSDVFAPDEFGRSVVLEGDSAWNQVVGPSTMLNPYMGATGVVTGKVYGDAVWSDRYPFDRIIGDPKFSVTNPGVWGTQILRRGQPDYWRYQQQIGRPQTWWIQPLGNSQGNEPLLVLRVAPAPASAYAIDVRLAFWAKRLLLSDLTSASTLPIPDQFLETALLPLAIRALMNTPIWQSRGAEDDKTVKENAADAIAFLKNQPGQVGAPDNRSGTPIGF